MYIIAKIQKKIKMVEKNMIGIKVEKKKKRYSKQHMNSRLQILLRKEYQCRVFVVYKKIKKKKIDRIKIKQIFQFSIKKKLK